MSMNFGSVKNNARAENISIAELKKELLVLRIKRSVDVVKDTSKFKKVRRKIAKLLTLAKLEDDK